MLSARFVSLLVHKNHKINLEFMELQLIDKMEEHLKTEAQARRTAEDKLQAVLKENAAGQKRIEEYLQQSLLQQQLHFKDVITNLQRVSLFYKQQKHLIWLLHKFYCRPHMHAGRPR